MSLSSRFVSIASLAAVIASMSLMDIRPIQTGGAGAAPPDRWEHRTQFFYEWSAADNLRKDITDRLVHVDNMATELTKAAAGGYEVVFAVAQPGSASVTTDVRRSLPHVIVMWRRRVSQ